MDLLEHLTKEHREVEALLDQVAETDPGPEREKLVEEIGTALGIHMAVEEQFVYPIVEDKLGEDELEEADNEHDLAREGLAQMRELVDEGGFKAAVDMVKAGIGHHVEDEEEKLFPELREKAADEIARLDPDELEAQVKAQAEAVDLSKAELYEQAKAEDIPGRSSMTKEELKAALAE